MQKLVSKLGGLRKRRPMVHRGVSLRADQVERIDAICVCGATSSEIIREAIDQYFANLERLNEEARDA
jgi:hypothetical protein